MTTDQLIREITAYGFTLSFEECCEDAQTPGLLGQIKGVTDWKNRQVRISLVANPTWQELQETLEHELHHVRDPEWDCANRDVLGRGGRSERTEVQSAGESAQRKRGD